MEKAEILRHLQRFIETKKEGEIDKKTARFLSSLKSATEESIFLGKPPSYFFAYIECNSTGVGTSSFQGTETQRTVSRDYVVSERLFIDGHIGAGKKGLSLFFLKPNQKTSYFAQSDIVKIAKREGFQIHSQYFSDLNYTLMDHRLNRYAVHMTQEPFSFPIRPILAVEPRRNDKITLGYIYEKDGKEHIVIEPERMDDAKEDNRSGCAPWMFLGFLFPPIFLVALFVMLVKLKRERMIG